MNIPSKVPEKGFYYHYKHDPNGSMENYAYEVLSVGFHTEEDAHFVNYLPIYDAKIYQASVELGMMCVDTRPLEMWMGDVEKDGKTMKRFTKITDPEIISKLQKIKEEMYKGL